jgi:uncharacterized membrane protein YdjX (TVP38/TMEM64 family)
LKVENREIKVIRGWAFLKTCCLLAGLYLFSGWVELPATESLAEIPGAYWNWMQEMAEQQAMYLLVAIVILPGFGFPVSPLLVLCGALTAKTGSTAIAWLLTSLAMWANAAWTYMFAIGAGRKLAQKFLDRVLKKGVGSPQAKGYQLAILIRATPGVPLPFQNYFLGVSGVPPKVYWIVTIPTQGLWALGFVIFGDGLLQGNSKTLIFGFGMLVAISIAARMVSVRFRKENAKAVAKT